MASSMFSTFRRYTRSRSAAHDSPSPATRKISFRNDEERAGKGLNRPFLRPRYRDEPLESDESNDDDRSDSQDSGDGMHHDDEGDEEEDEDDEDEDDQNEADEDTPLLPIFSSAHLDTLSVYTLTHIFRLMVISRCDTTLSWEQLRSPQVSQFLIKPIQEEIKANHLNAATQYALLANCLQFTKEASLNPGNSGNNKTRAMICELIAIKLLREYSTRQLIDALSYDFDPLQGQTEAEASLLPALPSMRKSAIRLARISCIEIALRAQSKRFLAHPVVVQHLEAIWNGSIVFHAAADSMHRRRFVKRQPNLYGTSGEGSAPQSTRFEKTVTLYNPRDASLFKLSRLRVPRYRNIFSTVSFAVLLGLFLAVLKEKSLKITPLEVVFWLWAAGYMLDEVLGFNDQGFSLYIASFWNTFDLGILLLLFIHLCLRLAGLVMFDDESTAIMAKRAYDVLALSAVLLFPRLFSVLDHYRYFSQLIIAFRMMAADMLAIFLLIVVFCSGFLVALTLAFANGNNGTDDPWDVAYALLQMLLGFTPAAWDRWDDYNWLGRITLISFLFICHFVVVTILITVMTNSFMEIVRNANEEHQYLFAVNTISNVKSDALFAYVPPGNVLQWSLTPLRYLVPFRTYIKVNRYIIKVTHFPILFTIFVYESLILQRRFVDSVDFLELKRRPRKNFTQHLPRLMRAPSIATFRQEAALAEVFKLPGDTALKNAETKEARKASNVVNTWMTGLGDEDAEPPEEDDRRLVDRLEHRRRPGGRRVLSARTRDFSRSGRAVSVLSDPNDFASHMEEFWSPRGRQLTPLQTTPSALELPQASTDADGDDELLTNESETNLDRHETTPNRSVRRNPNASQNEFFGQGRGMRDQSLDFISRADPVLRRRQPQSGTISRQSPLPSQPPEARPEPHMRNASFATMVYDPPAVPSDNSELQQQLLKEIENKKRASVDVSTASEGHTPTSKLSANHPGRKTPRKQAPLRPRPVLPAQDNPAFRSTPDINTVLRNVRSRGVSPNKGRKPLEMDIVSDIGDNKALGGGFVGALPASFAAQMRKSQEQQQQRNENSEMFGRMVMARMNTLEEGFREIIHEVREATRQAGSRQRSPERPPLNVHRASRDRIARKERAANSNAVSSAVSSVGAGEARPNTAVKLQSLGDIEQKLRADLEFVASIRQSDAAEDQLYTPVESAEKDPEHAPAHTDESRPDKADEGETPHQ